MGRGPHHGGHEHETGHHDHERKSHVHHGKAAHDPFKPKDHRQEKRTKHDLTADPGRVPTFDPTAAGGGSRRTEVIYEKFLGGQPIEGAAPTGVYGDVSGLFAQNTAAGQSVEMQVFGKGPDVVVGPGDAPVTQASTAGGNNFVMVHGNEYIATSAALGVELPEGGLAHAEHDASEHEDASEEENPDNPDDPDNPDNPDSSDDTDDTDDTDDLPKKWSKKKKGLAALTVVGAGVGAYFLGRELGWWCGSEDKPIGPSLQDRSQTQAPRDKNGDLTTVRLLLLNTDPNTVDDSADIDFSSVEFFADEPSARLPSEVGSSELSVDGGKWTSEVNENETDVFVVFTPDGSSKADPAPVWVRISNIVPLRSNPAKVEIRYQAETAKKAGPGMVPEGVAPKVGDYEVNDHVFNLAFFEDPAPNITQGEAAIDAASLELVDADGNGAAVLNFPAAKWEVQIQDGKARLAFLPGPSFSGMQHVLKYRIYDVDGRPSNIGTITVNFVRTPIFAMVKIGTGKLNAGDVVMADVFGAVVKGTNDINVSSLALKSSIMLPGQNAAVFDEADKVTYSNGETRGYTKMTIPGEGVWEVVEDEGTFKLKFTVEAEDFDEGSIVTFTVVDSEGYESTDGKVHVAEIYAKVAETLGTMFDKPDAEFWADFKAKVIDPSDEEISIGVMASVLDELLIIATQEAREQSQLWSLDKSLAFPSREVRAQIRDGFADPGSKQEIFDQIMALITYDVTQDPPRFRERSYWNRRIRLKTMKDFIVEYFAMIQGFMT